MADDRKLQIESKVIHAGQRHDPETGAVMQPVFQTSTYAQPWPGKHTGYEYARTHNPTREALERCVAGLESAEYGVAFGSGLAATAAIIQTLPAGSKVVCGDDVYGGTYRIFTQQFAKHGLKFSFADFSANDPEQVIPRDTDVVWLESPTNPLLKIADIQHIAAWAHEIGAIVVVDNTFATPIFQRPLELGADLVLHSTTKYINGHSDVVGGIVLTRSADLHDQLRWVQNAVGAVPGPWDTWLTLRGLKTLAVRMARHQENAQKIVAWLHDHDEVERIHYPMHESDPNYKVASKQMSGFGGMVSFVLKGDLARAEKFCASTKLFTLAESLGGVESLLELPAIMTHASVPADERNARGLVDGLIRLSIGIENADDLIADLQSAFDASR